MMVTATFEPKPQIRSITLDEARASVTEFLLDYVGNQVVIGEPHEMVSALKAVWIVPVCLTYVHTGVIGAVGVVAVDEETGQVIAWTPIAQMKAACCQLRVKHEPHLSEQFQAFVVANR